MEPPGSRGIFPPGSQRSLSRRRRGALLRLRLGRRFRQREDLTDLEAVHVLADRRLVRLEDRVGLVAAAVELLADAVEAVAALDAVLRGRVDRRFDLV